MVYNVVLVSGVQQTDSVIYIDNTFFFIGKRLKTDTSQMANKYMKKSSIPLDNRERQI